MPQYEYYCDTCTARFELLRPMERSADGADCPRCEAPAQRALSVFAAFTSNGDGETAPVAGTGGCGACAGGTCACSMGHGH
jgi:putative FmdB family regulatory protein